MNMRSFWWITLAFTLLWIWMQWQTFSQQKLASATPTVQQTQIDGAPIAHNSPLVDGSVPSVNAPVAAAETPLANQAVESAKRVHVKTDTYELEIDTQGGDIRKVALLKYMEAEDHSQPFLIMSDQAPMLYIAQNGIAKPGDAKFPAPTHKDVYQAAQTEYVMRGKTLEVPLTWEAQGILVKKIYQFTEGTHQVNVRYEVTNQTDQPWSGSLYSQVKRNRYDPAFSRMMYTYTGPVLYDGHAEDKYNKHSFDDLDKQAINSSLAVGGWAAMIQHYFVSAVIPNQEESNNFFVKPSGDTAYVAGVVQPMMTAAPGQTITMTSKYYIGPILQDTLAEVAPGLEQTVDYGVLAPIAVPIFWVLEAIYGFVGNWGWAIILLTILIKLLFYKLSETSYRSMARLKKFQPKLQQLKENYGDDKVIFQQKMMKLYKEEKINPLGGCLPILVQMPVFISLYWVFMYSTEMRQAEWILWLDDLSAMDPYYVLPVLMGISMYVQQKLNPSMMMDEMQQKVMKFLPFIFTFFFMWFPSGLVLYWVVNNIISVAQQWYITKKIAEGEQK